VDIGQLRGAESARASRLLARAFAEDPVITHFLYDPLRRLIAYPAFFRAVLEELLPCGHVYAARDRDDLIGVAAWKPADAPPPAPATRAVIERQLRLIRLLFPRASQGLFQGFAALEHVHPADPHWYLAGIGVDPSAQRQGVGTALLAPGLAAAERAGLPAVLLTNNEGNLPFYERHGFEIVRKDETPKGGPQAWAMVKAP